MIKVKICGIQRPVDALVAADAGADFIGMVFVPRRHRRLDTGTAKDIADALRSSAGHVPQVVGLFADQPLDEVNQTIDTCSLDLAQLCGRESPEYCRRVAARVIKVVHVDASASIQTTVANIGERVRAYSDDGHLVTLDRLVEGLQGGTGHRFDWDIAARLTAAGHSFVLAGGLTPNNVAQAVAKVGPWGVDVSTGVETSGAKEHGKIRAFISNARGQSAVGSQSTATDQS